MAMVTPYSMYTKIEEVSYKSLDGRKYITEEGAIAATVIHLSKTTVGLDAMINLLKKLNTVPELVKWLRESLPTDRRSVLEQSLEQIREQQESAAPEPIAAKVYQDICRASDMAIKHPEGQHYYQMMGSFLQQAIEQTGYKLVKA